MGVVRDVRACVDANEVRAGLLILFGLSFSLWMVSIGGISWSMFALSTSVILASARLLGHGNRIEKPLNGLDGKCVLITGASHGLGLEIARILSECQPRLIILGIRGEERANTIAASILRPEKCQIVGMHLDLQSFKSVDDFCSRVNELTKTVDLLICNAGVPCGTHKTEDGFNKVLQVNALAHIRMTHRLMPLLLNAEKPKIITTGSCAHVLTRRIDPTADLSDTESYALSKVMAIWHVKQLQADYGLKGLRAYTYHPGFVSTNILSNVNSLFYKVLWTLAILVCGRNAKQGSQTLIFCALTDLGTPGEFHQDCRRGVCTSLSSDDGARKRFWEWVNTCGILL